MLPDAHQWKDGTKNSKTGHAYERIIRSSPHTGAARSRTTENAEQIRLLKQTMKLILIDDLKMRKLCSVRVLHDLTVQKKLQRVKPDSVFQRLELLGKKNLETNKLHWSHMRLPKQEKNLPNGSPPPSRNPYRYKFVKNSFVESISLSGIIFQIRSEEFL